MSTEANVAAAVALLSAPEAPSSAPAPAPASEPAPAPAGEPAPAPTETAPAGEPAPAAAPAPAGEPAPAPDDTADLMQKLEARRAQRLERQAAPAADPVARIAQLEQEISALKQAPQRAAPTDFVALAREHGEVEALRRVGIDPLEFYNRFKEVARDTSGGVLERRRAAEAEAERLAKLEADVGGVRTLLTEEQTRRQQVQQAAEAQAAWETYAGIVTREETKTPLLARLPTSKQQEHTQAKIAWLQRNNYDVDLVDDVSLARLVEKDLRDMRERLLAGTDAAPSSTKPPAATDKPNAQQGSTTLSNDVAATATGKRKPMTADERVREAIAVVERAQRS